MARPLRRVVITLAIRLGIPYTEIERWDLEAIREHIVLLSEGSKPRAQTPEELERGLMAAFGKPKES